MKKTINKINKLLIQFFGIPKKNKKNPDPVDMLIGTILSQNTNDKNSYRAYQNLKQKYKTWDEVAKLTPTRIEKIIKVAGLGKQKSKAINNVLQGLKKKNGEIKLNFLIKQDDKSVIDELTKFDGVGIKTASCVLLFSMNRNVCPVDTHVHRTLNRIGLVKTKTPDKTFNEIFGKIPAGTAHSFHTNLIRLGREICKPTKPNCTICPLLKYCDYDLKYYDRNISYKKNDFMLLDNIS
ncbi:endonuclease III domain-containing protein [Bacteroidota bacterium]